MTPFPKISELSDVQSLQNGRYVILHADDFGMCHATNTAILHLLKQRAISSTTLMVNCPWSLEAANSAADNPMLDVGVHLTLTSEWDSYKWGPVGRNSKVGTLVDGLGHFPQNMAHMANADPTEVREELLAQVQMAIRMGVDPTHLDNHMGSLQSHHFDLFFELALQFDLPIRFSKRSSANAAIETREKIASIAQRAKEQGVLHPDHVQMLPFFYEKPTSYDDVKRAAIDMIRCLPHGVTELLFHPSLDTDELKAITATWTYRRFEYDLFLDPDIQETIWLEGIRVIGWRELRDLQRNRRR